jgi:hypothetical protein
MGWVDLRRQSAVRQTMMDHLVRLRLSVASVRQIAMILSARLRQLARSGHRIDLDQEEHRLVLLKRGMMRS